MIIVDISDAIGFFVLKSNLAEIHDVDDISDELYVNYSSFCNAKSFASSTPNSKKSFMEL